MALGSSVTVMNGQRPVPVNGGTVPPRRRGAPHCAPRLVSTADTQPFDQLLVPLLIGAVQVVENLSALRDELQQPASRVVVLDVALEVFGQVVDPLRQERDLDFGRTGIAGRLRVSLDQFRLACGRNRHRYLTFPPARPTMPVKLNTRLGATWRLAAPARRRNLPRQGSGKMRRKMAASRPRNKTAWPLWSLAASAELTASAGMSSSAVSIGRSASARFCSPAAAL